MVRITEREHSSYRSLLLEQIETLKTQSGATKEDRATVVLDQQSVGRLSRMDAMQQQAMAKATENRRSLEITRAEAALQRLKDGEFGYCTDCGEEIPQARLLHNPSLPWCLDCAKSR